MSRWSHEIIVSPRLAHAPLSILFLELTVFYNLRTEYHGSFTYILYIWHNRSIAAWMNIYNQEKIKVSTCSNGPCIKLFTSKHICSQCRRARASSSWINNFHPNICWGWSRTVCLEKYSQCPFIRVVLAEMKWMGQREREGVGTPPSLNIYHFRLLRNNLN